ncbi:MAG: hypothetical protein MI976_22900 [Pseudomonadales bacterium]|nr:hypothetical protein [Pseudomonadales bacterium]
MTRMVSTHNLFETERFKIYRLLILLLSVFTIVSCSHHKLHFPKDDKISDSKVLATGISITNAGTVTEFFPAAFIHGVHLKDQDYSLLTYSEFGRECEVLGKNGYTTDSSDPNGCGDCGDEACPAEVVPNKKLVLFSPSPFSKGKRSILNFPTRTVEPIVGVKRTSAYKTAKTGRYVTSRSPDKFSSNISSACYGPVGLCGTTPGNNHHYATLEQGLSNSMIDSQISPFDGLTSSPSFLSLYGGPHFGGLGSLGVSSIWLDPMISTIAKASGNSIESFPATVKLTTGIGRAMYHSIASTAVGETVYEAFLRNAKNEKIPLWHIRLLFGQQVNSKGFSIEVNSANNLKWLRGSQGPSDSGYLSDREVARLLLKYLKVSVNAKDLKAELLPKKGDFIPLHYQVSLDEDAELIERVQSSAIDEDLRNQTCKQ